MDAKTFQYCSSLFLLSLFSHLQNHQHHKTCWKDLKIKKNDNCLGSGTGCYLLSGGGGRGGRTG